MTHKSLACPFCDSHNLKAWVLGKFKCGQCENVFRKNEAVKKKYAPKTRRPTRKISDRHERQNARRVQGTRTIASGSTPVDKADVRSDLLRMECKTTSKKGYRLTREDFEKLQAQTEHEKIPVFAIEFRNEGQNPLQLYVLDEGWFLQLLELLRDSDDT